MSSPASDPRPPSPRPRRLTGWRLLGAAAAVLVPVVPIVIALVLTGGSGPAAAVTTTQTAAYTPVTHSHRTAAPPAATRRARRRAKLVPPGTGAIIGRLSHPEAMRASPGGRRIAEVQVKTGFGSPTYVLVTKLRSRWLGVINTAAGNGRIGWIRASGVQLSRDDWRLHAVLSRHLLVVYHGGREVQHYPIATGKPSAPTPTGQFAVTDRLTTGDPEGPYGCCILALSAKAPHAISDWDGGNRIAIHSTPETSSIGYSVSHGCMRLSLPAGQWLIKHIPLGTPAVISSA
jgi:hypothetical protein